MAKIETYCLLWVNMSPFLRFNAETQRRREKEGVCLQSEGPSDFLGTDPAKALQIGCLAVSKSFFQKNLSSAVIGCIHSLG